MRSDVVIGLLGLAICGVASAAPTYSCFDPPAIEDQTSPLAASMDDVVEAECCEALIDENDLLAGRLVVWDPTNCNHGPDDTAIAEAFLCRAHDTDGCRFCHLSCDGFEGLCITCDEIFSATASPTPVPNLNTPAPFMITIPFDPVLETPSPTPSPTTPSPTLAPTPSPTPAPTPSPTLAPTPAPVVDDDNASGCECLGSMTDVEAEVLTIRGKTMRCDPTCSNGEDTVWGVLNCNYFGLGQDCRTCADTCEDQSDGLWLDQYGAFCKPCYAIP